MKKEDINYVFEQNPELFKIGTKTQYYKYLKTIFPESKVKDIVYHGTNKQFKNFNKSKLGLSTNHITSKLGFYFVPDKEVSSKFIKGRKYSMKTGKLEVTYPPGAQNYPTLLNIKNPEVIEGDVFQIYAEENKMPPLKLSGDSILITPQTDNVLSEFSVNNYVVSNVEQIHILGSKKDISGFKEFVSKVQNGSSLEGKLISGFFILSFIAGLLLMSPNITGNVIGSKLNNFNFFGIGLILFGILGIFISKKFKKHVKQ